MKIGIVALHWPPNYGGAERYNSRLVDELNNKGVEAWGITPTAADENMDNGTEYVHRISTEKATALNDIEVCFIPKEEIINDLKNDHDFTMNILKRLAVSLKEADNLVVDMAQKTVKQRLAETLLYLEKNF